MSVKMVEQAYRLAIRIFAVRLHVVRIGDSAPAPMLEVLERFEPLMFEFKRLVADEMYDATDKAHPGCAYKTDMKDRENWGEAIEWLCDKAQLWLDATSQVFGEAHDRRSKFNYEQRDLRELES
jgi:hypothetical protein